MSGKRKTSAQTSRTPDRRAKAASARVKTPAPPPAPEAARPRPRTTPPRLLRRWNRRRLAMAAVLSAIVLVAAGLSARGFFAGRGTEKLEAKTVEELERLAVRRPNDARVLYHYGSALLKKGAANDASGVFQRVVQLDSAHPNAQLGLGRSLSQLGDLAGAEAAFKKAAELDPRSYVARYQLMRLYYENGEPQPAVQAMEAALQVRPGEASGWFTLGYLYGLLRREKDAARALERATVLSPNQPHPWRALGRVYWHMDRLPEAERALQKALTLRPNDPHTLWWLGQVYLKLPDTPSNRSRASEALQRATAAGQRPLPEAHVELARLYLRNDQPHLAEESLRSALRLNSDHEAAHFELGRLLSRLGRKAEGERLLARYEQMADRRRKLQTLEGKVRQGAKDVPRLLELARLYREYRDHPAAMRTYRRYLSQRPQDQAVVDEMAAYRREVMPQPSGTSTSGPADPSAFPEHDHAGHSH